MCLSYSTCCRSSYSILVLGWQATRLAEKKTVIKTIWYGFSAAPHTLKKTFPRSTSLRTGEVRTARRPVAPRAAGDGTLATGDARSG